MQRKPTFKQRYILILLQRGPKTVGQLADEMRHTLTTAGAIRGSMRRMEDRNWVRRITDPPTCWELTHYGRQVAGLA